MAKQRAIREVPHYGVGLDAIRAELTAGPAAIFVDFDGTLASLVAPPQEPVTPAVTLEVLARLTLIAPVVIISGRDTVDLAGRFDVEGVTFAGAHGWDVLHPDGRRERLDGPDLADVLDRAEKALVEGTTNDPGVRVERKSTSIAVHTRGAADGHARIAAQVLAHKVAESEPDLRPVDAKQLIELWPAQARHKGAAVQHLLAGFGGDHVPVVIGDDITDEDAFEVANAGRGVSVVVRGEDDWRPTCADWSADDTEDARRLLQQLAGLLGA